MSDTLRYRCPQCKQRFTERGPAFPFCSERCQLVDLSQWFGEAYRVSRPLAEVEDESDTPIDEEEDANGRSRRG